MKDFHPLYNSKIIINGKPMDLPESSRQLLEYITSELFWQANENNNSIVVLMKYKLLKHMKIEDSEDIETALEHLRSDVDFLFGMALEWRNSNSGETLITRLFEFMQINDDGIILKLTSKGLWLLGGK